MSLRELATRLGWDRGRLSKYETDAVGLTLPVIEEIAAGLQLRPEVVVLKCIQSRYPALKKSDAGRYLANLVNALE